MKKLVTALWMQGLEAVHTAKLLGLEYIDTNGELDGSGLSHSPKIEEWEKFIEKSFNEGQYKQMAIAINLLNTNIAELI